MSKKKKLLKFAQNKTFPHFFEPQLFYSNETDFHLKSTWGKDFFHNNNPITIELGCGKGEYTVEMARTFPGRNFIGIDIKGARMWKGAKDALDQNIKNVAFVRTRIEFTPQCFENDEVSEIWITFPDPQLGPKKRIKKRLTSSRFLAYYQSFLTNNGIVNLKTDDDTLCEYTRNLLIKNGLKIIADTDNLYKSEFYNGILTIKTHYEKMWNKENKTIKYLRFELPKNKEIIEPKIIDEEQD
jgi:tRNA (guanine-N7-)-methyltransferase